jgi:hypothetical protein
VAPARAEEEEALPRDQAVAATLVPFVAVAVRDSGGCADEEERRGKGRGRGGGLDLR